MNREIEVKILLTAEEYGQLLDYATAVGGVTAVQTNHYYDTADETLRQKGLTLRVRTKADSAELTLKVKESKWQTGASSLEYHGSINNAPDTLDLSAYPEILEQIRKRVQNVPESLPRLGSLTTERTCFSLPFADLTAELDQSTYFDCTDYELECELHDPSEEPAYLAFLKDTFGIIPTQAVCGKYHRFLNRLHEKQGE